MFVGGSVEWTEAEGSYRGGGGGVESVGSEIVGIDSGMAGCDVAIGGGVLPSLSPSCFNIVAPSPSPSPTG